MQVRHVSGDAPLPTLTYAHDNGHGYGRYGRQLTHELKITIPKKLNSVDPNDVPISCHCHLGEESQ